MKRCEKLEEEFWAADIARAYTVLLYIPFRPSLKHMEELLCSAYDADV